MDTLQARLMVHLHSLRATQLQAHRMVPLATDRLDSLDHHPSVVVSPARLMDLQDSPADSQLQQSQPHPAPMVLQASPTTLHDQAALMVPQAVPRVHTEPRAAHPADTVSPTKP